MSRLLLDLSHTSHTRAHTGIQHVCRSLAAALAETGATVEPVCFDPYESTWRPLRAGEQSRLVAPTGIAAGRRGAVWPLRARVGGRLRRWLGRRPMSELGLREDDGGRAAAQPSSSVPEPGQTDSAPSGVKPTNPNAPPPASAGAFIEPEIFSPAVARNLPALLARVPGPRVAIFHDAIALRLPEYSPPKTVGRYPAYLQELLMFDGVAAVSRDAAAMLTDYWKWLGVTRPPPVATLPWGIQLPTPPPLGRTTAPGAAPVVLSVGSIEGRKNHLALLEASELLWRRGLRFELRLIGLLHPQTGRAALDRLRELQGAGRSLHYDGPASETELHNAYRDCSFTVYPSLMEGFGLPVLESLGHGKPCICSAQGAVGEAARGGGCLKLETVDAPALADAIEALLSDADRLEALRAQARRRHFKSWTEYAQEFVAWMRPLPRRA